MIKSEKDFKGLVDRYSKRLLGKFDDLLEAEVLSRFNDYRETIEIGLEIKNYTIDKNQEARLFEADKQLIINIDQVLFWWKNDSVYFIRDKYIKEIKKEQWYWWFDEIKDGSYPYEILPKHLKEVCKKFYE